MGIGKDQATGTWISKLKNMRKSGLLTSEFDQLIQLLEDTLADSTRDITREDVDSLITRYIEQEIDSAYDRGILAERSY